MLVHDTANDVHTDHPIEGLGSSLLTTQEKPRHDSGVFFQALVEIVIFTEHQGRQIFDTASTEEGPC